MNTILKIKSDAVLVILKNRYYLKNENHLSELEFEVQISLNEEATEVFIRHLNASARLKHGLKFGNGPTTDLIINFENVDIDSLLEDLDSAYHKAIQFLDYKELKRDYAAGYMPKYLSDWLIAEN